MSANAFVIVTLITLASLASPLLFLVADDDVEPCRKYSGPEKGISTAETLGETTENIYHQCCQLLVKFVGQINQRKAEYRFMEMSFTTILLFQVIRISQVKQYMCGGSSFAVTKFSTFYMKKFQGFVLI
jgi:hypothetical protein